MTFLQSHLFSSPMQTLDIASCNEAAKRIYNAVHTKAIDSGLSSSEIHSVASVLDFYACCEEWDKIVDLASQAILVGVGPNAQVTFYRYWCEALRENFDLEGLQVLAKHFIIRARTNQNYAALALLSLTYAGRTNLTNILARHLKSVKSNNSAFVVEAYAVYLSQSTEKKDRILGLNLYKKVLKQKKVNFFSYTNFIQNALESEDTDSASRAINAFATTYPLATQPNLIFAQIEVEQKNYTSALTHFQNVLDCNPSHQEASLGFASCLEQMGNLLAAKNFLLEKENRFDFSDADYCIHMGSILEKTAQRYNNSSDKKLAINYYASALKTYQKLKAPEACLHIKLADLGAGVLEQKLTARGEEQYWMLTLDETNAAYLLTHQTNENIIVRCPGNAKIGDFVFIAHNHHHEKQLRIEGIYKVTSHVVPDAYYGNAMRLGERKVFEHAVDIKTEHTFNMYADAYHVKNFAETSKAYYYEVPHGFAEKIIDRVESWNETFPKKKAN